MVTVPPETLKHELESLLQKALETEDTATMEDLFHVIVDKSNDLRQRYGLPVKLDRGPLSVLKTPTEQLCAAGVGHETVMGHAVFARAHAHDPQSDQVCLFDQCFTAEENARHCLEATLSLINTHTTMKEVVVYPPLLLRAVKDEFLLLHLGEGGRIRRASTHDANLALVCLSEGPVVPVLARTDGPDMDRFQPLIHYVYGLTGVTNALSLEKRVLEGM